KLPGVQETAVVARDDGTGNHRLIAFLLAADPRAGFADEVRGSLKAQLPDWMVPALALVERLPRTPNGKIDRDALAAMPVPREAGAATEGGLAGLVAKLWCETLGLERVGPKENFFD